MSNLPILKLHYANSSSFFHLCLGTTGDIGNQFEGFLFSLSNPTNQSPQFFPIQQGKTSARTDEQLGPNFGQRDLELFEDENGRLMGFSGLGASFNVTNISLSSSDGRNYFAGSQRFYPDQVEVLYYHGRLILSQY